MNRSNVATRPAVLVALALAVSAPVAYAQSTSASGTPTTEAPMTAAPAATVPMQGAPKMKTAQDRQRALRSDTSANAISELEAKQAADTAREKGQPIEEEEEGTP